MRIRPLQPWHARCETCTFVGYLKHGQCLSCRDHARVASAQWLDRAALAACSIVLVGWLVFGICTAR